jgi:hypothetical protein
MNTNDIDNNRVDVAIKTGKRAEPERLLRGPSLFSLCLSRPSHTLLHVLTRMSRTSTVPPWYGILMRLGGAAGAYCTFRSRH